MRGVYVSIQQEVEISEIQQKRRSIIPNEPKFLDSSALRAHGLLKRPSLLSDTQNQ